MEPRTPRGKKLRILSGFLKGYPVWCTWQLTYNCNYGCDFCDFWQGKHSNETDLEGFEGACLVWGGRKACVQGARQERRSPRSSAEAPSPPLSAIFSSHSSMRGRGSG